MAKGGDTRFSVPEYAGIRKSGDCFQTVSESQPGTRLLPPDIKSDQSRPDIIEAILNGKEPATLTLSKLCKGFP
ncbi:MAG: hypothetical protein E7053_08215 [Lentisphaerae bacterium]|nr:hypothetical protein [Lentisphaerota bacterium]